MLYIFSPYLATFLRATPPTAPTITISTATIKKAEISCVFTFFFIFLSMVHHLLKKLLKFKFIETSILSSFFNFCIISLVFIII